MNLILQNSASITKVTCLAMCLGLGLSFSVTAGGRSNLVAPPDKSKRIAEEDRQVDEIQRSEGLQQTLNLNFSPEHREKLRKALDEYARSVDPSHDQIEERRRAMQDSIESRFFEADSDGDGTLDRQEATEKLPQIARHFNSVDINQDNLISLGELIEAQARIVERRKATEAMMELEKQQKSLEAESATAKPKNKQAVNGSKKKAL
ncbi:MAG TPA: EF-hand domain-containing protein [Methylotenera sp.]|nr:EF-hand domain-containing protein [Methylotenera sp.]HQS42895.1 EF-hand domain-containing protein [Methylotenera sp.]